MARTRRGRLALGICLVVLGAFATVAGVAVVALVGLDGSVGIASTRFLGTGEALTVPQLDVPSLPAGRHVTIDVAAAPGDHPLFLGIGPSDAVDAYLRDAPIDVIDQLDWPGAARTTHIEGTATPGPPAGRPFWVASAQGDAPSLRWTAAPGDWTLVVMRADGEPSIDATLTGSVTIPGLGAIGLVLLAIALALLGLGIWVTVRATLGR